MLHQELQKLRHAEPFLLQQVRQWAERRPLRVQQALRGLVPLAEARGEPEAAAEYRARLLAPPAG